MSGARTIARPVYTQVYTAPCRGSYIMRSFTARSATP